MYILILFIFFFEINQVLNRIRNSDCKQFQSI